ncbi:MAG: copper-translocating P-type ATPase [Lachnospiraceae bacterium]|nr:copper-translocating P-type ATPase [Lachnospiraceae bacterium]
MTVKLIISTLLTLAVTAVSSARIFVGVVIVLSLLVIIINRDIFISGLFSLIRRSPNADTLVSLGAFAAFLYSTATSVINTIYYKGSSEYLGDNDLYFTTCCVILTLIRLGKLLEELARGKTSDSLKNLSDLSPKSAVILENGQEKEIPIEDIRVGDIFVLKPGMSIPADGIVETGISAVNEAALTGEAMPVDKEPGMNVCASTINVSGHLTCRATGVGNDTTFSRIVRMVGDSAAGQAAIAKAADKAASVFIPIVILISVITFVLWMLTGRGFGFALSRAVSVLIVSCPAALGLAAPIAMIVGSNVGAGHGILFKTAQSMENTGKTQIVVVDKTGTLTTGQPAVTDILSTRGDIEHRDLLLSVAYALESKSEHPMAKAICSFAQKRFVPVMETEEFEAVPGKGIRAVLPVGGIRRTIYAGSEAFISESILGPGADGSPSDFDNEFSARINKLVAEGKTPTLFASESGMLGVIAVADEIRDGSSEAIEALHREGIHVCMVTGDRLATSEAVGAAVGIEPDDVISEVMPDEKAVIVEKLKETGKVAMIGDGINDAPALSASDVGIAIGAGTDIAIDAADVVLVQDSLLTAVDAILLSRDTLRIIRQNLFWAFFYNIIGIPLSAGCFYKAFGWLLDPMFCALAMIISCIIVIANSLRLFAFSSVKPAEYSVEEDMGDDPEEELWES